MKNLELLELAHQSASDTFFGVKNLSLAQDAIYFIAQSSCLFKYDCTTNKSHELCPKPFTDVLVIKILEFEGKICVVTKRNFNIFDLDGIEVASLEFDKKIGAISWNPTEEIIACVSESGNVKTFSVDYETGEIFQQGSSSVSAEIPDTVYVGWGSKDTQFRGSEGKLKKNHTPTQPETNPVLDQVPVISWRGNGEMFVVNYWRDFKREFVVFETPCKALFRSEDSPGLQACVAWRPSGNMIAAIVETNKPSVVVFEKNGQKRFRFELDFGNVVVKDLKWSPCAQVLLIQSENPADGAKNLHLMTSSNYKWYEKQTLTFSVDNPLIDFAWVETVQSTITLRAVTKDNIIKYTFRLKINKFKATCAVVNGRNVQITDFGDAIIPPTLFSKQISNENSINFVWFQSKSSIGIVDSKNILKIIDIGDLSILSKIELENLAQIPLACHHFICNDKSGVCYFVAETTSISMIYSLTRGLNCISSIAEPVRFIAAITENVEIPNLKKIASGVYVNCNNNSIDQSIYKSFNCQLTSNNHFYVNDTKVNDSVNSFTVFDDYLLYTTKLNEMFCLRFLDESLVIDVYKRSVEQGSSIVTAIPDSSKIVLQMPRGNLETISCRLISIDILDRLLNAGEWGEAIRFVRLEKLNANLFFDLNPARFLDQIDRFIDSVKTVNELNTLCLEFEETNVLTTIYKNWGKTQEFQGKIGAIFEAILRRFDAIDYLPYISTIVIINLNFFSLREALIYIQDILRRSCENQDLKKTAVGALNTLKTYGSDQDKLYCESLLLYDIDLAHFVASNCQMDPRIYEPHLSNLKNLAEVERRFEINLFAKKHAVAVAYLLRCPNASSDVILDFIRNHGVSREAYESCKTNSRHFKTVSSAFGGDLSKKGFHREAGVVFQKANLLSEALDEFKLGLRWREALNLMQQLEIDGVEKIKIVNKLASDLSQKRNIKEAAFLYEFHADSYEMAVKILIDNCFFEKALHLARKYDRQDIIVADILPALKRYRDCLNEKIADSSQLFDKYKSRLSLVRRTKIARFTFGYEGDERENDLFSDAGSVVSRSSRSSRSRSSTASSRNRRKEERKKQDLREGGIYEDIALIRALHCLIKEIYARGEDVRDCCVLLLQESDLCYKDVRNLYDSYKKLDDSVKESLIEIWPPHFYVHNQTQDAQQMADLENLESLDVEFRSPPSGRSDWTLNLFNKSLL